MDYSGGMETTQTYRCISDRYDNSPDNEYTLDDFDAMCIACFGCDSVLYTDGRDWFDEETDERVLIPWGAR